MTNNDKHINDILRSKFQDFEVAPPPEVWENIEKELDKPSFFSSKSGYVTIIALLILIVPLSYFGTDNTSKHRYLNAQVAQLEVPRNTSGVSAADEKGESIEEAVRSANSSKNIDQVLEVTETSKSTGNPMADEIAKPVDSEEPNGQTGIVENKVNATNNNFIELRQGFDISKSTQLIPLRPLSLSNTGIDLSDLPLAFDDEILKTLSESQKKKTFWEYSILLSPEFSLNDMDSVRVLNSISAGLEPTKYLNKHWFVRSGINISFTGDKGFAKLDYISNDLMGTYDDVYDVTFDTAGGVVTPVYHTKTVEVWDSVRHIKVSEVTNRYLYAQVPVLLGFKSAVGNFNIYLFAGPAVGFQLAKWIDTPLSNSEGLEIINLDNKLPLRSNVNFQLWIGGGLEYSLNKRYSLVMEPTFKHYFKSLYSDPEYKINTSGFALRFGVNIKIGK
ncbi:MAG: hypothetical protein GXO88_01860 [Chlorobi bacterium]|nr:hypothetical protein [Chlorobiota bacterium]